MNNVTFGNERVGYYETVAGGAGAGPRWHGRSGVHTHMTNTRITDPEVLEQRWVQGRGGPRSVPRRLTVRPPGTPWSCSASSCAAARGAPGASGGATACAGSCSSARTWCCRC